FSAPRGEIRQSYLQQIGEARSAVPTSSEHIESLNEAFEVLMDPGQRASYDAYLSGARPAGAGGRNSSRAASTQKPSESAERAASEVTRPEPLAAEQRRPTTPNLARRGGSITSGA